MALDVGKIVAAIEIQERYEAQLDKFVRQSERAARVAGDGLTRGGRTAAEALAATGTAADRAADSVAKVDRAAIAADKHLAMMGVTARQAADNQQRLALLSDQATERIVRGYTTIDQEHKRYLDKQERMADATERGASRTSSAIGAIGRAVVAAFAVERLVTFAQQIVKAGSDINDMAARTGISTDALQRFKFSAELAGGTLQQVTLAVGQMSKGLVGGDKNVVDAVARLGLNIDTLRSMQPESAFLAITDAIRALPDPMLQADAAMRIFGEGGGAILPMIKDNLRETGAQATVMSADTISALDRLGDAWTKVFSVLGGKTGETLGNLVRIGEAIGELAAKAPLLGRVTSFVLNYGGALGLFANSLDAVIKKMEAIGWLKAAGPTAGVQKTKDIQLQVPKDFGFTDSVTVKAEENIRRVGRAVIAHAADVGKLTLAQRQQLDLQREVNRQAQVAFTFRDQDALGWEEYAGAVEQARFELEWYLETVRQQPIKEATHPYTMVGLQGAVSPGGLPTGISTQAGKTLGDAMSVGLKSAFANIPQLLTQAFTGGGGVVGALKGLGVQIADAITRPLMQRLQAMTTGRQTAVGIGAAGAGAIGGAFGGSTGALIGTTAAGIAGAALATTGIVSLGAAASTTGVAVAATTTGMIALSAATLGIGAAAVGVYLLARHFFTVSKEVKQARADVQAFQEDLWKTMTPLQVAEAAGRGWAATLITVRDAYVRMGYDAGMAERLVAQLLDTSKPEAARDAMAQINGVVGAFRNILAKANEQMGTLLDTALDMGQRLPDTLLDTLARLRDMGDLTAENIALLEKLTSTPGVDFKKFKEAADRYGINEDALGQAYQQNKATATAQQMVDDVDLLLKGGASMGTILYGMREEISALVQQSVEFGTTLPENMQPWIEELAKSGLLLDKNGEKITDLSQIKFAESLETSFAKVIASIQKLIDTLTGPLQAAFGAIPKNVGVNFDVSATGGGQVDPYARGTESTDGFAEGTIQGGSWFRDFGRGTPTVLHGQEAVVRRDQVGAFVSAFSGEAGGASLGVRERPVVLRLRDNRILAEVVAEEVDRVLARRGVRR